MSGWYDFALAVGIVVQLVAMWLIFGLPVPWVT